MTSAVADFEAFNAVARFVEIVKAAPGDVYRYSVVGIDDVTRSRGNTIAFVLDRASWWENWYASRASAA